MVHSESNCAILDLTKRRFAVNLFFLLLGIAGDVWCILPIIKNGIFNIGNATGIVVFTCFILLGLFWKRFKALVIRFRKKKPGRIITDIAAALIAFTVILVIIESICMIRGAIKKPDGTETVVVLGSRVHASGPSLMTKARLDAAIEFMNKYPDSKCVLSGGQGPDEPFSEARGMAEYMLGKGISRDRLFLEDKSRDTYENLQFSKAIIEKEGLNPKISIVSNEFHLYRAGLIAKKLDLQYTTIPGKSLMILFPAYYIRELYAIIAQWVFGS